MSAHLPTEMIMDFPVGALTRFIGNAGKDDSLPSKNHFSVTIPLVVFYGLYLFMGSCHKRQKPQAQTPQAPIRNRHTRKMANAKGINRNTTLT